MTISLRDVELRTVPQRIRWTFELVFPGREPILAAVQSSRTGLVHDVQQLGSVEVEWPPGAVEAISVRIREELVRAKLAAMLAEPARDRWAA